MRKSRSWQVGIVSRWKANCEVNITSMQFVPSPLLSQSMRLSQLFPLLFIEHLALKDLTFMLTSNRFSFSFSRLATLGTRQTSVLIIFPAQSLFLSAGSCDMFPDLSTHGTSMEVWAINGFNSSHQI